MNKVYSMLTDLAACLCVQIEEDGSPGTCFCGVISGEMATADYLTDCDTRDGMAWVRLANSYPTTALGIVSEESDNCGSILGVDIEIGVLRHHPIEGPDGNGEPPTPEQMAETADQQIKDMLSMKRAVKCCSALPRKNYILGMYTPIGPRGGVVGGAWSLITVVP